MEHISSLIPATVLEKRELQKLESKPHVTGEEKQLVKSLQQPQIINEPIEKLVKILRLVMVKVGLRSANFPGPEETEVLLDHVITNYGGHTHEEIKLAFDMAITNKLQFPEKQDANHYENFSCEYFSRVMNAYRRWAGETYRSVIDKKIEKKEEKQIQNTQTEKIDIDEELWNQTEFLVKYTSYQAMLVPPSLYDWADKNGNINVTKEQKMEYIERATLTRHSIIASAYEKNPHSLDAKITLNEFNDMRKNKSYSKAEHDKIIDLSKRMIVFDMMKSKP